MKTLGFSSGRVLRMVLGESMLLSFIGAALRRAAGGGAAGYGCEARAAARDRKISFAPAALAWSALIALGLGLLTGLAPALQAYRMSIVDALGRR